MEERFINDFVTWRHNTSVGIKVDEVFGMDSRSGNLWIQMAKQIFSEQGPEYRSLSHFDNGAPYLEGYEGRISLTHTSHFLSIAFLPRTPEVNLEDFNPRSAMGIDAERLDRQQVLKIRSKFLSEKEMAQISEDNLRDNILAWTSKEALYKASLCEGLDFKENIILERLPQLEDDPMNFSPGYIGKALLKLPFPEFSLTEMNLFSYESYGCCVTIAFSPKCAKFHK